MAKKKTNHRDLSERIKDYILLGSVLHLQVRTMAPELIDDLLKNPPSLSLRSLAEAVDLSPTYISRVKNRQVTCSLGAYLSLVHFAEGLRL